MDTDFVERLQLMMTTVGFGMLMVFGMAFVLIAVESIGGWMFRRRFTEPSEEIRQARLRAARRIAARTPAPPSKFREGD